MDKKNIINLIVLLLLFIVVTFLCRDIFLSKGSSEPIKLVYITDDNYVTYMRTSINSVIANKKPTTKILVYVIGHNLNSKNIKRIQKIKSRNVDVKIVPTKNVNLNLSTEKTRYTPLVTQADNAKFFLSTLINNEDKILYLDCDTIVLKDLSELFNTNLADNYIAAVDDWMSRWEDNYSKRYFNNGVMLLNLKEMRKDDIQEKLINYKKNDKVKRFVTQDAFNSVMYGKVLYLPLIYNTFAPEYNDERIIMYRIKTVLDVSYGKIPYVDGKDFIKKVVIIHYCGFYHIKPWIQVNFGRKSNIIWYKYAPPDFWAGYLKKKIKKCINKKGNKN